jgi:ADP-ribose pyrophosphatase
MPSDLSWDTIDLTTSYTCPGFDVRTETVRLPDETTTQFDSVRTGESVVVLPFTPDGEVVIIEEWRQAVERVSRGLPAGGLEADDVDLAQAARRELREETGYRPGSVSHLTTTEPANGFADTRFHYFLATDCQPTATQELDRNESIRVETTSFAELRDAVRDGNLRDGRAAFGILYYALFGE